MHAVKNSPSNPLLDQFEWQPSDKIFQEKTAASSQSSKQPYLCLYNYFISTNMHKYKSLIKTTGKW